MIQNPFPAEYFERQDPTDDDLFYVYPRKVVHIDDHAIQALGELFGRLLPPNGVYLDLMSSWRSHLPETLQPQRVIGLGMNADEMRDNRQLHKSLVHNLNRDPQLPFEAACFDAAFCTVSVQYLTRPFEVFAEVYRVLKPGGVFVVSFSNRCFPTKAIAVWLATTDAQHLALVTRYFEGSAAWREIDSTQKTHRMSDPLYAVWAKR
ncbi:MAG: class I SAM-dependent methyltransferase [Anaerolineae bacterium]|jgi:SAM-dependent methyltransferase|nr:class I SAM-dependent methyltransferase [Anaerolineae bacterium]